MARLTKVEIQRQLHEAQMEIDRLRFIESRNKDLEERNTALEARVETLTQHCLGQKRRLDQAADYMEWWQDTHKDLDANTMRFLSRLHTYTSQASYSARKVEKRLIKQPAYRVGEIKIGDAVVDTDTLHHWAISQAEAD